MVCGVGRRRRPKILGYSRNDWFVHYKSAKITLKMRKFSPAAAFFTLLNNWLTCTSTAALQQPTEWMAKWCVEVEPKGMRRFCPPRSGGPKKWGVSQWFCTESLQSWPPPLYRYGWGVGGVPRANRELRSNVPPFFNSECPMTCHRFILGLQAEGAWEFCFAVLKDLG